MKNTDCTNPNFITAVCAHKHLNIIVIRCHKCEGCLEHRKRRLYAMLMEKFDFLFKTGKLKQVNMWTFGTNMVDTENNRKIITQYWKKFRTRMAVYTKRNKKYAGWKPLLRVVEAGSKGNRLHLHVLVSGYIHHSILLKIWRNIVGYKANVNVRKMRGNYKKAVNYVVKYVVKELGSYYQMGLLLKTKFDRVKSIPMCSVCGSHVFRYQFMFAEELEDILEGADPPPLVYKKPVVYRKLEEFF